MFVRSSLMFVALLQPCLPTQAQIMPLFACCPKADSPPPALPVHELCARLKPGMSAAEVLAIMGRGPDSWVSGQTEPVPGGAPASTYTVDEWYSANDRGYHLTTQVRYRSATVDSIECGKPVVFERLSIPLPSR